MVRKLIASAIAAALTTAVAAGQETTVPAHRVNREWLRNPRAGETEVTLWPGETQTLGRVTVKWKFSGQPPQQVSELLLSSEGVALPAIPMPPRAEEVVQPANTRNLSGPGMGATGGQVVSVLDLPAYLDGTVVLVARVPCGAATPPASLVVVHIPQPSLIRFPGQGWKGQIWVSAVSPVQLDRWHLTVSPDPVAYPDGSRYHTLTVQDGETSFALPLAKEARREFGRFGVDVEAFCPVTRTASLSVRVGKDSGPLGADSLVENLAVRPGDAFGPFLERTAKDYGFTCEWDRAASPDLVGFLQRKSLAEKPDHSYTLRSGSLEDALDELPMKAGLPVVLSWTDAAHLTVTPTDAAPEQMRREAERPIELQHMQEAFDRNYGLQTRAYQPARLKADTLKGIVDRELGAYALLPRSGRVFGEEVEGGQYYMVARLPNASDKVSTAARESALFDEKANTVIVTAAPPTHERIAAAIAEVEKLLSKETAPPAAPLHRVEVILLRGLRESAGGTSHTALSVTKTLRPDSELTYRDLRLRVTRVNANNATDGNDDSVEMVVRTATTSEDRTIQEYRSEFLGDYEINVINVTPSANPNESTVKLEVRANQAETPRVAQSGADYGLTADDLKVFGVTSVEEIGRGVVNLVAEPGETGKARLALGAAYAAELQFLDRREPYLVLRGRLAAAGGESAPLIENTLYLEKGKPSVLGITNLRDVVLLVARLPDSK
jgi:hypothetical protein